MEPRIPTRPDELCPIILNCTPEILPGRPSRLVFTIGAPGPGIRRRRLNLGAASDVWIFQIAQNLELADGAMVTLSGGAQASNIFWQVAARSPLERRPP